MYLIRYAERVPFSDQQVYSTQHYTSMVLQENKVNSCLPSMSARSQELELGVRKMLICARCPFLNLCYSVCCVRLLEEVMRTALA